MTMLYCAGIPVFDSWRETRTSRLAAMRRQNLLFRSDFPTRSSLTLPVNAIIPKRRMLHVRELPEVLRYGRMQTWTATRSSRTCARMKPS